MIVESVALEGAKRVCECRNELETTRCHENDFLKWSVQQAAVERMEILQLHDIEKSRIHKWYLAIITGLLLVIAAFGIMLWRGSHASQDISFNTFDGDEWQFQQGIDSNIRPPNDK